MSFGMAYATKKRGKKCMAKGGEVKFHHPDIRYKNERGVNAQDTDEGKRGESHAGVALRAGSRRDAKEAHRDTIQEMRAMPKPKLPMAEGGEVAEMGEYDPMENPQPKDNEAANMEDADMIARIMHKRKEYSEGGMVANDVGVAEADEAPAEYDDLVLDDHLEDDSSAGNEHGDAKQDARNADVISKIISSRKKKDKMPRPA